MRKRRPYSRLLAALGSMLLVGIVTVAVWTTGAAARTTSNASVNGATATTSCAAKAKALVTKYEKPVSLGIQKLPKPAKSLNLGQKSVAFLGGTSFGVIDQAYQGYAAAGQVVGLNVKLFNVGFTTPAVDAAIQTAVNEHVSAIAISAETLAPLEVALSKAAAAHIPVISQFETKLGANIPAVKGQVTISTWLDGMKAAAYAMEKTNCHVTFAFLESLSTGEQVKIADNVQHLFKQNCPKTCHFVSIPLAPNDVTSTQVAPLVTAAVQNNPHIQYIYADNGEEGAWVLEGLKAVNDVGKIGVLSEGGTANVVQQLQDKSSGYTGAVDPPTYYMQGWAVMDATLKTLEGWSGDLNLPQRLVITGSAAAKNPLHSINNYRSRYKKAWGVKG